MTAEPPLAPVHTPPQPLGLAVERLADAVQGRGWRISAAESCTGGLIAACCTDRPGSSVWFDRGFVTYSNAAKTDQLGVAVALLEAHGAVSEPVARAMALGALERSQAQLSIAVTGIAGPGGAVPGKPVGTVWMAWAWRTAEAPEAATEDGRADGKGVGAMRCAAERLQLTGDRAAVRWQTVAAALARLRQLAESLPSSPLGPDRR